MEIRFRKWAFRSQDKEYIIQDTVLHYCTRSRVKGTGYRLKGCDIDYKVEIK
jgi:hypothetical protein